MRASRLLSILLLLQTRRRMTARALAEELETSVRTIHRDIDQLSAAGVPVYADHGRSGGFRLLEGYRTQLTGLSPEEAETVLLAGLPGPAAELGLADAMAGAQLKLLAALPDKGRSGAARIAERFHLDPVGWFRQVEAADILPVLAEAVWTERKVRVRYESWAGVVDRDLEPLGVALKAGVWYLVAQAEGRPRTYRVSAIQSLSTLDETFERPAGFDLAGYWSSWVRDFEARIYRGEATLRLSPRGVERLAALEPAIWARAKPARLEPDETGWREFVVPIESIGQAAGDVLRLGAEVEVLTPAELRRRVAEIVAQLSTTYSDPI